jgi:hypothetical protein
MVANRDAMSAALEPVYGSATTNLQDWEGMHWVAEGYEAAGPGDKASWYKAEGASGTHYGDLEYDYWTNVYAGGGGSAPVNTVAPALNDVAPDAGETLTVTTGTWTGTPTITYAYQWESSVTGSGGWSDVSGETTSSLLLDVADEGLFFRCEVTATNGIGSDVAYSDVAEVSVSVDPGLALLESATLWLDASDDIANAQWKRNKGTGGRALDARQGSVGSAQIVKGALKLNGVLGNFASAPDSAALDLTGDCELVVRLAALDWTPAANMRIICKRNSASVGNYELMLDPTGALGFSNSSNGGNPSLSTAVAPFTDGTAGWVKVTYRNSDRRVQFFTAADSASEPGSFTQLGTDVTHTASGATADTNTLCIGGIGSSFNPFNGTIYRAIVRNGIGGSTVFDADFTAVSDLATSFTESSSNAATVTINSTTGVDTNDPLLLTHTGTNYLYLPGVSGNGTSTASSAALQATSQVLDIQARVAMTDWTPSADNAVVAKSTWSAYSEYALFIGTSGAIGFNYTLTATPTLNASVGSSVATGFADGTTNWIRATRDPSTGDVTFYTAPDSSSVPGAWTQLGTVVSTAAGNGWGDSRALTVGIDENNTRPLTGAVYRARVVKAGTTVFDADFTANTNQSSFTESSSNAATVTINRSTSGRKAVMVTRPVWLFGTDDYMEVADNALLDFGASESYTIVGVMRAWGAPSLQTWLSKMGTGKFSYNAYLTSGMSSGEIFDGTFNPATNGTAFTAGTASLFSFQRDVVADKIIASVGSTLHTGATDTTTTTLESTFALNVGRRTASGNYFDGEIIAVAVFRSALTSTELGDIATYYGV